MSTHPITIAAAARLLGVSRQTASRTVAALCVGVRLGESQFSPLILSAGDFRRVASLVKKNAKKQKFQPGNKLWQLREKKPEKIENHG